MYERISHLTGCLETSDRKKLKFQRKEDNLKDPYAVTVIKPYTGIVGQVPLSQNVVHFYKVK